MTTIEVIMVRIYLENPTVHLTSLLKRLNDWGKVKGIAVFDGLYGFGANGEKTSAEMLSTPADQLPVVIEFFDEPNKISAMLDSLTGYIGSARIVSWNVNMAVPKIKTKTKLETIKAN